MIFLCIVVFAYFIVPLNFRWCILLIGSAVFYCIAGVKYIPFIAVTSLVSFFVALYIAKQHETLDEKLLEADNNAKKQIKEKSRRKCRRAVIIALVVPLGILSYTKFTNMVIDSINGIINKFGGFGEGLNSVSVIVPLGISYYTFSTIGYVLDVYWNRYEAETSFFRYLLYVLYFPHILQGPIARYNRLAPQLFEGHRFEYKRFCYGLQLMVWGFFKKLVIADRLAIFVNNVYGNWQDNKGFVVLVATFFYAFQFYTDFSGCVDIAKGVSEIFGISLDDNFLRPYFSQSVAEYWRRWHITLGTWFKDYLYMPVSRSRIVKHLSKSAKQKWGNQAGKNVTMILSLAIVWLATGLWHGTGWTYIVWGIWHGGIIITSTLLDGKFTELKNKLKINQNSIGWRNFRIFRTFLLTAIIPRIITRAGTIPAAIGMFKNIFAEFNIWVFFDQSLYTYGLDRPNFWMALLSITILFVVDLAKEKGLKIRDRISSVNIVCRWVIYYVAIFSIIIFGIYGEGYDASSFIYMNF
jgi:D-alanyl-lipoteichoic acid acyltransferase DltB (MBOAT superfamily)